MHHLDYSKIPEATFDFHENLRQAGFPIDGLVAEIVSPDNMSEAFDYVVSHLDTKEQRDKYWPQKERIVATLAEKIRTGVFRIDQFRQMVVTDGPKDRVVQAPSVRARVGCHAIMVIVEKYTFPTLITNTAASVKGKGMHWLFHRIEDDYEAHPEMMQYFYKSDIMHFYDSIDQGLMKEEVRRYICDPVLLPMLDNFIELLPVGLSKGLRSSQCFANLFMSPVDHYMNAVVQTYQTEEGETRYLYERYMDDSVVWGAEKPDLWLLRDLYHQLVGRLGLTVKPDEAVRPIGVGLDYLGFIFYGTHSRLRKRTKQKAARHLAKVKSRKRRQEIIGSFKGMACHADCKHLYLTLTHRHMKKFSEMGVAYTPEGGKKRFPGKVLSLGAVVNRVIEVYDYETDVDTKHGADRYIVSFKIKGEDGWYKFFTASEELKYILDRIGEQQDGFPFETTITQEYFDGGKRAYKFT